MVLYKLAFLINFSNTEYLFSIHRRYKIVHNSMFNVMFYKLCMTCVLLEYLLIYYAISIVINNILYTVYT